MFVFVYHFTFDNFSSNFCFQVDCVNFAVVVSYLRVIIWCNLSFSFRLICRVWWIVSFFVLSTVYDLRSCCRFSVIHFSHDKVLHERKINKSCCKLNVQELSTEIAAFENATIFKRALDRARTQPSFYRPLSARWPQTSLPTPLMRGENVEKLIFALSSNLRKSASQISTNNKVNC